MTAKRYFILLAAILLAIDAKVATGQGNDSNNQLFRHRPYIKFPYLSDPATFAVAVKTEQDIKRAGKNLVEKLDRYKVFDLNAGVDALYPLKYHPEGLIRGDLGFDLNWLLWSGTVTPPPGGGFEDETGAPAKDQPRLGQPHLGSLSLKINGEACQIPHREEWQLNNYNVALDLKAQIPGTRLDLFGWLFERADTQVYGLSPLVMSFSLKSVFQRNPEITDFTRLDATADWGFYLTSGAYVYPHGELSQMEGDEVKTYVMIEIVKYFYKNGSTAAEDDFKPLVLARYVDGRKAPEFVQVSEWYIGVGVELPF